MKKIVALLILAAFAVIVACHGEFKKEEKIIVKDSVITKDVMIKHSCCQNGADSCKMKCCSEKACDSLCNELSKIICKIVELKVKESMCQGMKEEKTVIKMEENCPHMKK
jgi:hypothetical protein